METLECIKTRRSCKKFLNKLVPKNIADKLIEAAMHAPFQNYNGDFEYPWRFIVITRKDREGLVIGRGKDSKRIIREAPLIIAICVDRNKSDTRWVEDGSVAAENMLLAAHDLRLGAVWITGYSKTTPEIDKAIRTTLNLPEHVDCVALICIGYSDYTPKIKLEPEVDKYIHQETW